VNIAEVIAQIPYARRMGIEVAVAGGAVVARLRFRPALIGNQRLPAIHGGMVGAFLEMAAIAELVHRLGIDHIPKPVDFNVNYLRSAGPADCTATTEVVKLGRRIAHVRVAGWQEDPGRPFASGYGNFLL
jgi:acyl-coenzyme A thioesterase PaaI-like protein